MISARYVMPAEDNFHYGDRVLTAKSIRLERFQRSNNDPNVEVVFDEPVDLTIGAPEAETILVKVLVSCGEITLSVIKPTPHKFQSATEAHVLLLRRPLPAPFVSVKKDRTDASTPAAQVHSPA